jgi:hypothetical protein
MAEELDLSNMLACRVAFVEDPTRCSTDEPNRDALDLNPCFGVDYSLDQVIVGMDVAAA